MSRARRGRWRRWRAPAPRSCASPSTATRRRPPCRTSRSGCSRWASTCRSSATSTTSATSCCRSSGLRRGARQIPHQSRQCRLQGQDATRSSPQIVEMAIKHGKPVRIGVNWGSLDQELLTQLMDENSQSNRAARRARGDARGHGAVGAAVGRARRGDRPAEEPHHPLGESLRGAGPDRASTPSWRAAPTTRCISASPKPAWARRASSPRRPPWACCCSRASATPSAFR